MSLEHAPDLDLLAVVRGMNAWQLESFSRMLNAHQDHSPALVDHLARVARTLHRYPDNPVSLPARPDPKEPA